ncbi:MAG: hypothetical protein DIU63_02525 [Proteobacteria bacterium]|nr:MAG: hypothetical protein DIU63_02525 [Pseudomonadota bacterium]
MLTLASPTSIRDRTQVTAT